jgi:hypothetical protein
VAAVGGTAGTISQQSQSSFVLHTWFVVNFCCRSGKHPPLPLPHLLRCLSASARGSLLITANNCY